MEPRSWSELDELMNNVECSKLDVTNFDIKIEQQNLHV